MNPCILKS